MFEKNRGFFRNQTVSWFDFFILVAILIGGFFYLHDVKFWSASYIGETQYGDAQFWWHGAVHFSQGIFEDSPGKGFRPGYFILTGLALPLFGLKFQQFYPYFLLIFLMVMGSFYLALRQPLNRWVAACVAGMIVYNPYTAEWLATSTTDATGLLLHIAALSCLLTAIRHHFHKGMLIAFSVFFSLAVLTRPLMAPFIVIVLLALLYFPKTSLKDRLLTVVCVLAAFCLPLALWMGVQKIVINQWAISSNDASAFYAASHPSIQTWKSEMYAEIDRLILERFHVKSNEKLVNEVFWQEAVHNYIKYPFYHLNRILPHFWTVLKFSPKLAVHGTETIRAIFFLLIAGGLALWLVRARYWFRAFILFLLGWSVYFFPMSVPLMTIGGACFALCIKRGQSDRLGMFLLSIYWMVGVFVLYFVGGTGGPPVGPTYNINTLGYRLGLQVYFVGELLAGFFLLQLAFFRAKTVPIFSSLKALDTPSPLAGRIVTASFYIVLISLIGIYVWGGAVVMKRTYNRFHSAVIPYPPLIPVIDLYKQKAKNINLVLVHKVQGALNKSISESKKNFLFTGTVSPFVWNMPGQKRAHLMVHTQDHVYPYTMGPGYFIVEVPQHLNVNEWIGAQGAFIIENMPNVHDRGSMPHYLTMPAIRAFIPLAKDAKSFDLKNAKWFPFVTNATQLETSGVLKNINSRIVWKLDSGPAKYKRRFFISTKENKNPNPVKLILDLNNIRKAATLTFSYGWGESTSVPVQPKGDYHVDVSVTRNGRVEHYYHQKVAYSAAEREIPFKEVRLFFPKNTKIVEITFNHLEPSTGIWIYEFNLETADFAHIK